MNSSDKVPVYCVFIIFAAIVAGLYTIPLYRYVSTHHLEKMAELGYEQVDVTINHIDGDVRETLVLWKRSALPPSSLDEVPEGKDIAPEVR